MNRSLEKTVAIVSFSITLIFLEITFAGAWQIITHYQLGVESGLDPTGSFQNLPDSWPSHDGVWKLYQISEWFAWSHGVLRNGRTSGVPNLPVYPSSDQDPGKVIYKLYRAGGLKGGFEYDTAMGFLAHNAQDRQVHYRYFRGGSKAAWREEHEWKEIWADCWIYRIRMGGKFDVEGRPLNLPNIDNRGNPGLISRAQSEFIASGLSTDAGSTVALPGPEVVKTIDGRISNHRKEISDYLRNTFNLAYCNSLGKWARNYDWNLDELEEYYFKSLNATKGLLAGFPP
jgi:hypothetical protein